MGVDSDDSVEVAFAGARLQLDNIDTLINNAGVGRHGSIEDELLRNSAVHSPEWVANEGRPGNCCEEIARDYLSRGGGKMGAVGGASSRRLDGPGLVKFGRPPRRALRLSYCVWPSDLAPFWPLDLAPP